MLEVPKIGHDRSGTGDAFAGIVAASLLKGENLERSVQKAADFISKCLQYAEELELPWNYGIPFEEYLTELR
jgi:pyridoxine kinase